MNALMYIHANLPKEKHEKVKGIDFDTFSNRISVMSYGQYNAYCKKLRVCVKFSRKKTDLYVDWRPELLHCLSNSSYSLYRCKSGYWRQLPDRFRYRAVSFRHERHAQQQSLYQYTKEKNEIWESNTTAHHEELLLDSQLRTRLQLAHTIQGNWTQET